MNKIINYFTFSGDITDKIHSDYVQIELLGNHAVLENSCMLISANRIDKVLQFKWYLGKDGYPITHGNDNIKFGRGVKLHKLLYGKLEKGFVVDHINRNRLDNRNENLRICTQKLNSYNRSKPKNSKNKYKGVTKINENNFVASISKDGTKYEIKNIPTEIDAGKIYDLMCGELFGEFGATNFCV